MFLTPGDAQFIVDEVKRSIQRDINIMDERGVIIASTNAHRISQIHEGARQVLQQQLPALSIEES
ncbi:MAG: sugar diacid recognition domain-containing protein, partial [Oscillibacter sp.]